MSEGVPTSRDELSRQARRHLESLRAAGVEWLPLGEPDAPSPAQPAATRPAENSAPPARAAAAEEVRPAMDLLAEEPVKTVRTLDQRRQELKVLAERVAGCTRCPALASTRTQTVFGDGSPGAELCFIGEAPGADEDAQGVPFVGAAGQLLDRIIAAMGLKREDVYICNILRCRPPGNRTPLPNEAANCREYLERTLELVQPKFICALGGCAAQNLLGTTKSLGQLRGKFHDYRGIPVLCTYHPAYLLPHRNPAKKKDVWDDMKLLLTHMGRPVPAPKK
jgi:DNA polymerase